LSHFCYKEKQLFVEQVALTDLAKKYQSPLYVYSKTALVQNYAVFDSAFSIHPHLICYAVKANSNLAILKLLAEYGAGFDVVSLGELERVIVAGGNPQKIVLSGVGKTISEIEKALELDIKCINIESIAELDRIIKVAKRLNKIAPVSFRVNPNVDAKTHPYISTGLKENKFGIDIEKALDLYLKANEEPAINIVGVDCHIGSQITQVEPFLESLDKVCLLVNQLKQNNINIKHIDVGGGIGIDYEDNITIDIKKYITQIIDKTKALEVEIILEPGRAIIGNAGVFITQVEYLKPTDNKSFCIVDGAMNDLIRPSLYDAYHNVLPLNENTQSNAVNGTWDIVGPICETGDFLAKNRKLSLQQGDYLAVMDAGAYGFTMSSNYNSRPRVAEVMVSGDTDCLIRKRETVQDLYTNEVFDEK
jgi:diaminopimelate decarboxylase